MSADNPLLCLLFVPGNRPERFAKALAAGADAICIDLEAAVPDADKDSARDCVLAFLRERAGDTGDCRVMVRLNPLTGQTGQADLEAFASQQQALPDFVMTTLTESAAETRRVHDSLAGQCATFALIESVQGLHNAADIAACEGVAGLMLGGADLSAQLRAKMNFNTLLVPRSQLVFAAAPRRHRGGGCALAGYGRRARLDSRNGECTRPRLYRQGRHPPQAGRRHPAGFPPHRRGSGARQARIAGRCRGGEAAL